MSSDTNKAYLDQAQRQCFTRMKCSASIGHQKAHDATKPIGEYHDIQGLDLIEILEEFTDNNYNLWLYNPSRDNYSPGSERLVKAAEASSIVNAAFNSPVVKRVVIGLDDIFGTKRDIYDVYCNAYNHVYNQDDQKLTFVTEREGSLIRSPAQNLKELVRIYQAAKGGKRLTMHPVTYLLVARELLKDPGSKGDGGFHRIHHAASRFNFRDVSPHIRNVRADMGKISAVVILGPGIKWDLGRLQFDLNIQNIPQIVQANLIGKTGAVLIDNPVFRDRFIIDVIKENDDLSIVFEPEPDVELANIHQPEWIRNRLN